MVGLLAPAGEGVESNAHFGIDAPVDFVASPLEEVGADGWVVAYLLEVEWTATYPTLQCFSKNGIEWLLQTDP